MECLISVPKTVNTDASKVCEVCYDNEFKYKCPGCFVKTCSIECVKNHKIEFNCDGKPVNIPFRKMADLDDKQFFKDFNFLEEGTRLLDCLKRDRKNIIKTMDQLPPWLKKLVYEARCRGTRLKLLPAGFEKRNQNKTTYMYDKKEIRWDVQLIFTHITVKGKVVDKPSSLVLNRISENITLKEVIDEVINPKDIMDRIDIWKFLTSYRLTDPSSILVLLSDGKKFYEVDMNQNLTKILQCRTIIEYPTFVITLSEFRNLFSIEKAEEKPDEKEFVIKSGNGQNQPQNGRRRNKKGKRKFGKGLEPYTNAKLSKLNQDGLKSENIVQGSINENPLTSESAGKSAIDEARKVENTNFGPGPLSSTIQMSKTVRHDSDVSSLSTDDDEDYKNFVNIGFTRSSSGT